MKPTKQLLESVFIPCHCCRGKGQIELTGVYLETLHVLRGLLEEYNGAEIARMAEVPETAMNNRLVRLEQLGLAESRRFGRERLWKARAKS